VAPYTKRHTGSALEGKKHFPRKTYHPRCVNLWSASLWYLSVVDMFFLFALLLVVDTTKSVTFAVHSFQAPATVASYLLNACNTVFCLLWVHSFYYVMTQKVLHILKCWALYKESELCDKYCHIHILLAQVQRNHTILKIPMTLYSPRLGNQPN